MGDAGKQHLGRRHWSLPSFVDPDVNRRAVVLHWVTIAVAVILVVVVGLNVLEDEDPSYRLAVGAALLVVVGATQWLLRSDRPRVAAHLFTGVLWLLLAVGVIFSGGTESTSAPILTAVTLIGGLVIGVRAALAYTGASILFLFGVFLADERLPPSEMAYGPFAAFTTVTALLVFTAGVLALGLRQLERAIAEARAHQAALIHKQRLESIGLLAGGIAHDFNNLLTVISASAGVMKRNERLPSELASNVDDVQEASRRAADLTRQLLAFGRKQELAPRAVDLNGLVRESGRLLRRVIPERIRIDLDVEEGLPEVYADPTQISQVLINLAVNGRDAIEGSGTITMRTGSATLEEARARDLDLDPTRRHVVLEVSDSGTGIPREIRDRIFDPFFTTKPQGRGTGLGLSTTVGIVKQSGGAIEVQTEPGQGTTMCIYLPEGEPSVSPSPAEDAGVDLRTAVREALASHDMAELSDPDG